MSIFIHTNVYNLLSDQSFQRRSFRRKNNNHFVAYYLDTIFFFKFDEYDKSKHNVQVKLKGKRTPFFNTYLNYKTLSCSSVRV